MDAKTISDWLQWLAMAAIGLFAWIRKPGEEAQASLASAKADLLARHSELQREVITLTERVKHMPTSDELAELEGTVKAISMQAAGLTEAVSTIRVQLNRIEGYLLKAQDSRL